VSVRRHLVFLGEFGELVILLAAVARRVTGVDADAKAAFFEPLKPRDGAVRLYALLFGDAGIGP
jgi:hypothetical protein